MFIDNDFPKLLGAELFRPDAAYITKYVTRPMVVHDFTKQPGETVQLDRYQFWNEDASFTLESRERNDTQTIGTANSRDIPKDKVILTLREYTGPSAAGSPSDPSTFKIPMRTLLVAQRKLWDYGVKAFHDSIGSMTLLRDFRKWEDRAYVQKLLESPNTYNPRGVADGGTYASGPTKFSVTEDLMTTVESMRTRNVPVFEDGCYACLASPRFIKHLRQDPDFRAVARYPGAVPITGLMPGMPMGPAQIPYVNSPNTLIFGGGGVGQSAFVNGVPTMPTGFVYEGVRFFETTNLPTAKVSLNYTASTQVGEPTGSATRDGHMGIFFGPQAIGIGIGGPGPEVLLNNNDDFSRFVIAIWRCYGAWALLNKDFVTVARSYGA